MTEPTVQVPVSLIEDALNTSPSAVERRVNAVRALRALLSQQIPTADEWAAWERCEGPRPDGLDDDAPLPSPQPPRIEDMAPGTTFRLAGGNGMWMRTRDGAVHTSGVSTFGVGIDPSTIRDVIPPKG